MRWGSEYRELHLRAWREVMRVLKPSGLFVVNVSNHIRKGTIQRVVEWHLEALLQLGLLLQAVEPVATPRMRLGANASVRVGCEHLIVVRNHAPTPADLGTLKGERREVGPTVSRGWCEDKRKE